MTTGELAKALVAFQQEMPKVAKTKTANAGSYSYKYADLADVSEAATPVLTKHGLSFTAHPRRCDDGAYELVGELLHVSGESKDGALPIRGNSPQEMGSSITYMRRYLFGCLTGLITDQDDDGAAASTPKRQASRGKSKASEPPAEPQSDDIAHAKTEVRKAWLQKHGRYSQSQLETEFSQFSGLAYDDADVVSLAAFADELRGATGA